MMNTFIIHNTHYLSILQDLIKIVATYIHDTTRSSPQENSTMNNSYSYFHNESFQFGLPVVKLECFDGYIPNGQNSDTCSKRMLINIPH